MKQKTINLLVVGIFVILLMLSFVAASFRDNFNKALEGDVGAIVNVLLGSVDIGTGADAGEVLFVKLLVFILLLALVTIAVRRIPQIGDYKTVTVLISLVVSVLAIRFITTENLINFIWLPYGTIGILLSAILPFLIGFFFIEAFESSIIRKVGWTSFLVIFAGLAYTRWKDLAIKTDGAWYMNLGMIYLIIAIISGILLLYDRQIRRWKFKSRLKDVSDRGKKIQAAHIQEEIDELTRRLGVARTEDVRKALREEIREKKKSLVEVLK